VFAGEAPFDEISFNDDPHGAGDGPGERAGQPDEGKDDPSRPPATSLRS
jgi:hypothetical protein